MANIKGPGEAEVHDGSNLRVAIVHARWNARIIDSLISGAKKQLHALGVKEENITLQSVPGSYELPFAVQRIYAASHVHASSTTGGSAPSSGTVDLLASNPDLSKSDPTATTTSAQSASPSASASASAPFDAIIAIGVLIKGETMHFEYIADAVSHGLMRAQLDMSVPVIFGLLTVLTEEQGMARAGLETRGVEKVHNHGEDWGSAAVELGVKRRGWADGKFL